MQGSISARHLPAPVYFAGVALATALVIAAAMWLRPAFAHSVLEWTGLESEPRAKPGSFYAVRVAPVLDAHCTACHGANRQKAQLRLDSFAAVMRGGRHGAVVTPGDATHSALLDRITLPASDDKAMPPSGKAPLDSDEVTVIRLWIATGASGTQSAGAIKGAPRLVVPVTVPEFNPAAVAVQRAPLAALLRSLQARFPGVIDYQSRSSADLEIDASLKGAAFDDAGLRALLPLRGRIVRADLSGTGITDASAPVLAAMKALRFLRLRNTRTTDTTIRALAPLRGLKSLSVAGATPDALVPLRGRGVMIYGGADVR